MIIYTLYKGDTLKKSVCYQGYSNSADALYVSLRGSAGSFDGTLSPDTKTGGYIISISTTTLDVGTYDGYVFCKDDSGSRVLIDTFLFEIKADFLSAEISTVTKSFARQALEIVEKQILQCSSNGYISISTDGKTIQRITITELMKKKRRAASGN